ncbi:unnamed protein product [Caenorhabditis nigoni]
MDSVKLALLNLNFWYTFCGIYYSFFSTPYIFVRVGLFFIGILSDLGVPKDLNYFFQILANFLMVLAFLTLFENRSSLIVNNIFRFKNNSTRTFWIFLNISGCTGLFIPVYFNFPDSDEAKFVVLKTLPCPPKYFFTENTLVFPTDSFWHTYLISNIFIFCNFL